MLFFLTLKHVCVFFNVIVAWKSDPNLKIHKLCMERFFLKFKDTMLCKNVTKKLTKYKLKIVCIIYQNS